MKNLFTLLFVLLTILVNAQALTITAAVYKANCNCSGKIDLSVSGGTPPYAYQWSNPDFPLIPELDALCPGTYTVTVTDATGITATRANDVGSFYVLLNNNNYFISCHGSCDGSIGFQYIEGGQEPYSYSWSNGSTTSDQYGLCAGSYSYTITDANGCSSSQAFEITQPDCIFINPTVTNPLCTNNNNGSITLATSGGASNYDYAWSNGSTLQDLFLLTSGTYTVTVTDNAGCTASSSIAVSNPSPIIFNFMVQPASPPTLGAIDLNVVLSGTSPVTFDWSSIPGNNDPEDIYGLVPGPYCVTLTDANGCSREACETISTVSANPCSVSITALPNGQLSATATGGIQFSFSWSTVNGNIVASANQSIVVINAPGTYCVIATDIINGCTATACYAYPSAPFIITAQIANAGCSNGCSGSIDINTTGGSGSYSYMWSTGATTQDISNLCPGTYNVDIYDDIIGFYQKTYTVSGSQGAPLDITITSSNPAYCNNVSNLPNSTVCEKVCPNTSVTYAAELPNTCALLPAQLVWTVTGATSYNVSADTREVQVNWGSAGQGLVTVTGSTTANCFYGSRCIDITAAPKAQFTTIPTPGANTGILQVCKGQKVWFQNQSLEADQYEWQFADDLSNTNAQNTEHAFNQPGIFKVLLIARTACLCADSTWRMVEVLASNSPLLDCVSTVCPGEEVTYTADGQCGQYNWNISPNGTITGGGGASENTVTVQWNSGSEGVITLNATACSGGTCPAPAVTVIPILSDDTEIEGRNRVCPNNEETYKITLFKGSNYVWQIKPGTGAIAEGQGREKITVQWVGSNIDTWVAVEYDNCYLGCKGRDTLLISIRPPFTIVGEVEKCSGTGGNFQTQVPGGVAVISAWQLYSPNGILNGNISNGTSVSLAFNSGPGNYRIFAVPVGAGLNNTCSDSAVWNVKVKPNPPVLSGISGISGPNFFCAGSPLTYKATSTSGLYNIQWEIKNTAGPNLTDEGPSTVVNFTNGSPRWVSARQISTDGLGCLGDTVMKQVKALPPFQITGITGICPGTVATYSAPTLLGVTYYWSIFPENTGIIKSGQNSTAVEVFWLEPGNHKVIAVTCSNSTVLPVTVFTPPVPDPVYPDGVCPTGGGATLDANGVYISYQWKKSNGLVFSNSFLTYGVGPGSYALVVTDANGCKGTKELTIIAYPQPNVRISTVDRLVYCNEPINVKMTALTDADGDFLYEWYLAGVFLLGTDSVFYADAPGSYGVGVHNQYGCADYDGDIVVKESCAPPPPPGPGIPGNPNTQTCPEINFDIIPGSECDSFHFAANVPTGYMAGSETWLIRRQGFSNLAALTGASCSYRFPNAGQFIVQLTIRLNGGGYCTIAKEVDVLAHAQYAIVTGCPGTPTLFKDESTFLPGSEDGASWHWDFNDFASANSDTSLLQNPSWLFANPLIYNVTLTVKTATGCTTTSTFSVNIPDPKTVTFLPQTLTCAGNSIPLAVNTSAEITEVAWNFNDPFSGSLNQTTGTSVFHNYGAQGNYTITATATNITGCKGVSTFPVSITPNTLGGNITPTQSTICEGKSIILTAPPGGNGATYIWSTNNTTETLLVSTGGNYSVTVSTPSGCIYAPPPKIIDVNPAPDGAINAVLHNDLGQVIGFVPNQLEVCKGEDVYLEVKDNGTYQYTWSGGMGTGDDQSFTEDRDNLLTVGTHNYAVTITNAVSGCTSTTPLFTVDVHPTPEGFSASADHFCAGTPSTVSYNGPQPADWLYFWNNGEVGTSFQTLDPGHFFVKVINQFGCKAASNRVTIHPGPNIGAIPGGCHTRCGPDSLCIAPMPEITSWQWFFDGAPVPGATTPELVAAESGSYYVAVSDTNGCSAASDPLNLTLYTGYGDVFGKVWSDVNDNGIIDAGDTLISQVPVLLWSNDTLRSNQESAATGDFTFAHILATPYIISVDSSAIPSDWEIVIGQQATALVGCDSKANVALLLHLPVCQTSTYQINISICPGSSYEHDGVLIPIGSSQQFIYPVSTSCDSTVNISVTEIPMATFTRTEKVCLGSSFNFMGTDIPVGSTQTFTLPHPVTGCDSVLTIQVESFSVPVTYFYSSICEGETLKYNGIEIPAGTIQDIILVNPVTGCDSLVTVTIGAIPLATTDLSVDICPGTTYLYNGQVLLPGSTYEFHFSTQQGECDSTVYIAVSAWPAVDFTLKSTKSCQNTPTGSIMVEGISGGTPPFEVSLNTSTWQNDLIISNLPPDQYTLQLRDALGCLFSDEIDIIGAALLSVTLPAAVLIHCDTPVVALKPLISGDQTGLQFAWSTGATTAFITATDAGVFGVQVQNQCETITRSTTISWAELPENQDFVFVPNTIAPEAAEPANAILKSFFVPGIEVVSFHMEVFDRWGDLIWRGFDVDEGWDSRDFIKKQNLVGSSVYVWWLTAEVNWCGRTVKVQRKGDVTVVR